MSSVTAAPIVSDATAEQADDALVAESMLEESLVEEISIDGMCGVY